MQWKRENFCVPSRVRHQLEGGLCIHVNFGMEFGDEN